MSIQPDPSTPGFVWMTRAELWIPDQVWQRHDMRLALAQRDIAAVYRILQKYGVSQRRIAAVTDQSQSEISEIMAAGGWCHTTC